MKATVLIAFIFAMTTRAAQIDGKVLQVVDAGILVIVDQPATYDINGIKQFQAPKTVLVTGHGGQAFVVDGERISCTANLSGRYQYTAVSGGTKTIEKYACPSIAESEAEERRDRDAQIKQWEAVNAAKAAAIAAEEKRRKESIPRIVAYQLQQASNGYPSFQLELGKRYLRGDGVAVNTNLAIHWLKSACTNHESGASNLLQQITR